MAGIKIHTAQTDSAITLAELKAYLKVDSSDDDTVLNIIKQTVDAWAKDYTGRTLCTTTYQMFIDTLYDIDRSIIEGVYVAPDMELTRRAIHLPFSPVSSISHVKYYGDDDVAVTYASSNYFLDNASEPSRFTLKTGKTYPSGIRPVNGFEIQYVAGYGDNTAVPLPIKQACLIYGAHLFEQRGDTENNPIAPTTATRLLTPFVIQAFSSDVFKGRIQRGGLF